MKIKSSSMQLRVERHIWVIYLKFSGINFALFDCLDTEVGGSKLLRNVGAMFRRNNLIIYEK